MIEKCASLALEFYGEMDAEDQMDNDEIDDDPENQYDLDQEDPPDPQDAANNGPGEQGGDYGSEQGRLDHLPWCNGQGMTTKPTKMKQK
jgi:hypothetical protein